jgi:Spy/CpxP family protein refolding chaperone
MKKILTAAAALLFSVATFAQANDSPHPSGAPSGQAAKPKKSPMTPEQRAKRETDKMNELVPLGAAYQKVLDLNTQTEAKKASIANGAKRNELTEDQKMQMKALNEQHKKSLETAMGKDLYEKFKAAEKAKRDERKNQGGGAPPMQEGK